MSDLIKKMVDSEHSINESFAKVNLREKVDLASMSDDQVIERYQEYKKKLNEGEIDYGHGMFNALKKAMRERGLAEKVDGKDPGPEGAEIKPEAPATKSQKSAEKEKELGKADKTETAPPNTGGEKTPPQGGTPMPDAPKTKSQTVESVKGEPAEQEGQEIKPEAAATKSQKKVEEEVDGGDNKGPEGDAVPEAPKTKTTDRAPDVEPDKIEVAKEQPVTKTGANEKKINEQPEGEELEPEPGPAPEPTPAEVTDTPADTDEVPTPADPEAPDKQYLGQKGDAQFYLVRKKNDAGDLEDIVIQDAEENEVFSAKADDPDASLDDVADIILKAIQQTEVEVISYELFMEYFYPKLSVEEEPEEEEEEVEEPEAPAEEPEEEPEEPVEGKVPDPKASTTDKIDDLREQEDKIVDGLMEKYGLK